MISHMKRHRKPTRHRGDRLQCAGFCTILIAALLADGLFSSEPLVVGALVLLALTVLGGGLIYAGNYIKFYSQVEFGTEKAAPRDESTESGAEQSQ